MVLLVVLAHGVGVVGVVVFGGVVVVTFFVCVIWVHLYSLTWHTLHA